MKPSLLPEPERWSERGSGTSAEDAVGATFKRIRDATEPSNVAAARWARSAMAPVRRASAAPRLWAAAIAGTILVGGGAAAGIVWHAHVSNARAPAPVKRPDETELLARAFRLLRSEGDVAGALAALDEHDRRFGAGSLAIEATLARAEALLLLGRTGEALPLLMRLRDARAGLT